MAQEFSKKIIFILRHKIDVKLFQNRIWFKHCIQGYYEFKLNLDLKDLLSNKKILVYP